MKLRERGLLRVIRNGEAALFVYLLPPCKTLVVDIFARFKLRFKRLGLCFRWVDSVLQGL